MENIPSVRYEKKYLLGPTQYLILRDKLERLLPRDGHGLESGLYSLTTLYYDTQGFDLAQQKIGGEYRHVKIRQRQYGTEWNPQSPTWTEIKYKQQQAQLKLRKQGAKLNVFADFIRSLTEGMRLFPVCHVHYQREAFQMLFEGKRLRVNFDHHLSVSQNKYGLKARLPVEGVLMETKYDADQLPNFITHELQRLACVQTAFSKYDLAYQFLLGQVFEFGEVAGLRRPNISEVPASKDGM